MPEVGRSSTSPANVQRLPYYPGPDHTWERPQPEAVGIDSYLLQEAIAFANDPAHAGYPPDLGTHLPAIHGGRRYDDGVILGPTKTHGSVSGVVLRHGYLVGVTEEFPYPSDALEEGWGRRV